MRLSEAQRTAAEDRLRYDTPFWAGGVTRDPKNAWRFPGAKEFQGCVKILDKRRQLVPAIAKPWQLELDEVLETQRAKGLPMRVIICKARQLGFSTWIAIKYLQRVTQMPYQSAVVVAQDVSTAGNILAMAKLAYAHLPTEATLGLGFGVKPAVIREGDSLSSRKHMVFGEPSQIARREGRTGESIFEIDTAGSPTSLRGRTINLLHLCLAPETRILLEDGQIVPVCQVPVGAKVLTHMGASARISAITRSRPTEANGNGETVVITPWLGESMEVTPNHPIYTPRGWVQAGDLTVSDRVAMPIRKIEDKMLALRSPPRPARGGPGGVGAGELLPMNEEVGFAMGYYLAEGSLNRNKTGASAITFSRHRSEKAYADRAIEALTGFYKSRRTTDRRDTLTSQEVIYCSPLARFVEAEFGATDQKRVPDWVFDAGEPFCRGLLTGYLCGDGSKTSSNAYNAGTVSATTVCASIATQMRDIAASLGIGWAAIDTKAGGNLWGRQCRDAWIVRWHGQGARTLRAMMGLEVFDGGRPAVEKYEIADRHVWTRLREISHGSTDWVYDVEVDHPDHSFRTLYCSVKNSEVAFWEANAALGKMLAALEAVPYLPETIVAIESTANGLNHFHKRWLSAKEGSVDPDSGEVYVPLFVPWWRDPDCARQFATPEARERFVESIGDTGKYGELAEDESMLIERYKCSAEQLFWRRMKIQAQPDKSVQTFKQENPASDDEAFIGSGHTVFPGILIAKAIEATERAETPVAGVLRPSEWKERRSRGGSILIPQNALWVPAAKAKHDEHQLEVWEHPRKREDALPDASEFDKRQGAYVLSCDVAGGEANTFTQGDYHVVKVFDWHTRKEVATHASRMDIHLLPLWVLFVALYYNEARVAVEVNNHGIAVVDPLTKDYRYRRMYKRERIDVATNERVNLVGWDTSEKMKPAMEATFMGTLDDPELRGGLRDRQTARELATYIVNERGKHEAVSGEYDDRLMAAMIAQQVMAMKRPPKIGGKRLERFEPKDPVTGW